MRKLFTSESVTEGHPDKICDQISDAILDELLRQDPMSRVACETTCTTGLVVVLGEITTRAQADFQSMIFHFINPASKSFCIVTLPDFLLCTAR